MFKDWGWEGQWASQWRHNQAISNRRRIDCLFNCLFRLTSNKTLKPALLALDAGNPPVTGGFPSQRASNAETVSIWWCHHGGFLWWAATAQRKRPPTGSALGGAVFDLAKILAYLVHNMSGSSCIWGLALLGGWMNLHNLLHWNRNIVFLIEFQWLLWKYSGARLNIKMLSYLYRDPHIKDKTARTEINFNT